MKMLKIFIAVDEDIMLNLIIKQKITLMKKLNIIMKYYRIFRS